MATLLKERARKPIIDHGIGRGYAVTKVIDGGLFYGYEIREPWQQDGRHQTYGCYLTEQEMLAVMSEWTKTLARSRP